MIPPDPVSPPEGPAFTAPPRAVRLQAKPLPTEAELRAARLARKQKKESAVGKPADTPRLEKKLAGLHDAQDMLRVMDTELALQRSARLHGAGDQSRQAMRVLSVTVLFALLIAALAALGWLQSRMAQSGISRHRVEGKGQR